MVTGVSQRVWGAKPSEIVNRGIRQLWWWVHSVPPSIPTLIFFLPSPSSLLPLLSPSLLSPQLPPPFIFWNNYRITGSSKCTGKSHASPPTSPHPMPVSHTTTVQYRHQEIDISAIHRVRFHIQISPVLHVCNYMRICLFIFLTGSFTEQTFLSL